MLTLKEIDERNKKFWEEQNRLRNERIQDPVLVRMLEAKLNSLQYRLIPAARTSVEQMLEDAAREKETVLAYYGPQIRKQTLREQARKAGKSKGPDALQRLIFELVCENPVITAQQVLEKLQAIPRPDPVVDVDETEIAFSVPGDERTTKTARSSRLKTAPISGLKDRVSRAKKFLNSR